MTKIDRPDVEDRVIVIDDEKKRVIDWYNVALPLPEVDIYDEPTRCYKINLEWAKIVMGMVAWLTEIAAWKEAQHEGYVGIEQVSKFLEGVDCMLFQLRQNPTDLCLLEQSFNGGETWFTVFNYALCESIVDGSSQTTIINNFNQTLEQFQNTTYNNYVENYISSITDIHPELAYGDADDDARNLALCNALIALIDVICLVALEYINNQAAADDDLKSYLLLAGAILGVAALAATGVGTPAALALAAQAAVIAAGLGLGSALIGVLADIYNDAQAGAFADQAAKEELLCCLYEALKDTNADKSALEGAFSGCSSLSANAQSMADLGAILIQQMAFYAGFAEKLAIGFESAKLNLLPACPCDAQSHPEIAIGNCSTFNVLGTLEFQEGTTWHISSTHLDPSTQGVTLIRAGGGKFRILTTTLISGVRIPPYRSAQIFGGACTTSLDGTPNPALNDLLHYGFYEEGDSAFTLEIQFVDID